MDKQDNTNRVVDAFFERVESAIKNESIITTLVIQKLSPYLIAKFNEFLEQCGFKKISHADNVWIFKSLKKSPRGGHKEEIVNLIQKDLKELCSFNPTEFPVNGLIHINGDKYGIYNITISCDEKDSPKIVLTPVEW